MVERVVYGSYSTNEEALQQAEDLVANKGVPALAIVIVGNESSLEGYTGSYEVIAADTTVEAETTDGGFFNNLFGGLFAPNQEEAAASGPKADRDTDFEGYRNSLNNGEVLVLVDAEYEKSLHESTVAGSRPSENLDAQPTDEVNAQASDNLEAHGADKENIKLHEERLQADVHEDAATSGDVNIEKRVVENEQTVDVPVRHEEVRVEHQEVKDDRAVGDKAFQEEEIDVHVSNEEANITKETYVTDEVDIEKEVHTDHETVKDTTRKEVLDVEDDTKDTDDKL